MKAFRFGEIVYKTDDTWKAVLPTSLGLAWQEAPS
jgi:hypothetical protein